MLDDFLIRAALAGVGAALAAGALGCFVVWRRIAYFGDATSHAAILGVALSLALGVSVTAGVLVVALAIVLLLTALTGRHRGADTVLGVLAHSALAFGLLAVAVLPGMRVDLDAYLFGDVLTVTRADLGLIWGGAAAITALIAWRWRRMLLATLDGDLATASGVDPKREELILMLALATVVAVSLKVVGALLITALLIIPAAAARGLARRPETMAVLAALIGGGAAIGGLRVALWADSPVGPTIVAMLAGIFAAVTLGGALAGRR